MKTDYDLAGCIAFYGKHIQLCIKDWASGERYLRRGAPLRGTLLHYYQPAEKYLFGGGLEDSIHRFGLPLDPGYIKRMARKYVEDPSVLIEKYTYGAGKDGGEGIEKEIVSD